jgi:hypothetical protein
MDPSKPIELRRAVIESYHHRLANDGMTLVPIGHVQRGPGCIQESPVKPLSYNGYPHLGIVFSVGLPKDSDPPEWLIDVIKRIEAFAINELDKIEAKHE